MPNSRNSGESDPDEYITALASVLFFLNESVKTFLEMHERLRADNDLRFDVRWREPVSKECDAWQKVMVRTVLGPRPPEGWELAHDKLIDAIGLIGRASKYIVEGIESDDDQRYAHGVKCTVAYLTTVDNEVIPSMPISLKSLLMIAADYAEANPLMPEEANH